MFGFPCIKRRASFMRMVVMNSTTVFPVVAFTLLYRVDSPNAISLANDLRSYSESSRCCITNSVARVMNAWSGLLRCASSLSPSSCVLVLAESAASERAYKKTISGFTEWTEAEHAEEWLIFPENIGPYLCIDETCLSTGEVYTIVSNKDAHGKKGCIVAIIKGTRARDVIKNLKKIDSLLLAQVKEVTLDFSESMHSIVKACFPNAMITLDRFHHQQFCLEAVQEVRIAFRREEMTRVANLVPRYWHEADTC